MLAECQHDRHVPEQNQRVVRNFQARLNKLLGLDVPNKLSTHVVYNSCFGTVLPESRYLLEHLGSP